MAQHDLAPVFVGELSQFVTTYPRSRETQADADCLIDARNDVEAIECWLYAYRKKSPHTQAAFRKEAVIEVMDKTERTSSMVENLNRRVRVHIRNRQEIGFGFLDLLRFFMNHSPIVRSARPERKGRSPAEILSGKPQPHWLELLGFERFKRTA